MEMNTSQTKSSTHTELEVNTTGNETSKGERCSEEASVIENSKPTSSTTNNADALKTEQISSDDDFIPQKRVTKQYSSSSSEDICFNHNKTAKVVITEMLPDNYDYKFLEIFEHDHTGSYHCNFGLKLQSEEGARKWVTNYNEKTKETMVYERSKAQNGKRVVKMLYLHCQHNQRQTGKHTKVQTL